MTSVGDYLRKEREARHLSVQEVAALTKISERYLACIECGDYDQLPPGPYAKGYIAAYARQVCGDETEALELYAGCRATSQLSADAHADEGEAILGAGAAFPPPKGKSDSKWQATVATGLSFARSVRKSLPQKGNLKHLSNGGAKEKPALSAGLRPLLAPLSKLAAGFTPLPKGVLFKGGLVAGLVLVCAAVLVLAGFGAYHLFIFREPSQALSARRTQAAEVPSTADAGLKDSSTAAAPPVEPPAAVKKTSPVPTPKPSNEAPQDPPKKVKKALKTETFASKPAAAETTPTNVQKTSPAVPAAVVKQPPKPLKTEARTATVATSQPSTSEPSPPQTVPAAAAAEIPVELIKASVCVAVEERMPVGVSEVFPWTTPKIFVWSLLGAKEPPDKVRHIYYHADRMVSDVTLKVGSSHWRTWSFHTLSGQRHIGPWHVDIATMDGQVMRRLHFEIR